MVICQFYMQGRCRYGDRCYNEHPAGNSNSFLKIDKKIYESMVADVLNAERGKQWPLSCYAPFKDHPPVPNLKDTSAEELRHLYYQARNDNRLGEYVTHVSGLIKESDNVRQFLKTPSPELGTLLENILTKKLSEPVPSASSSFRFDVNDVAKSGSSSIFGGTSISQPPNIFAQPSEGTSIFSNSNTQITQPTSNQSIFGGPAANTSHNVFGNVQSNQNIFENSCGQSNPNFRQPLATNSVFENKNNTENIFQQNTSQINSNNLFSAGGSNVFEAQLSPSGSINVFDTPKSSQPVFNQSQPFSQNTPTFSTQQSSFLSGSSSIFGTSSTLKASSNVLNNCYTPLEELSDEEKAMFMAPKFAFQKIPLRPPPESLCT